MVVKEDAQDELCPVVHTLVFLAGQVTLHPLLTDFGQKIWVADLGRQNGILYFHGYWD